MSLVICSNSFKDDTIVRQNNSIDNPFSFRNALSSTYTIPANSQVALQSAKLNIDGKVVYSRNSHKFYQYFGKQLNLDGETEPQIEDTTSHPILIQLAETEAVQEKSPSDFAVEVERSLNERIFHPNMKNKVSVSVLKNASDFDFKGYKIVYDQENTKTDNKPTQDFKQWYRKDGIYAGSNASFFSYTGNVFQRNASLDEEDVCAGINTQYPLNLGSGVFEVNISHGNGNVNASGTQVEFAVGLSRFVNNENWDGYINPSYFDRNGNDELGFYMEQCFMDFGVGINDSGEIVCFQSTWFDQGNGTGYLKLEEVEYWNNASSSFTDGRADSAEGQYTKFKFEAEGERIKS